MGKKTKVTEKDNGLTAMLKNLGNLASGYEVRVGVQGPQARSKVHGDITNVELFTIHEYGAPKAKYPIPARPSLRPVADEKQAKYMTLLGKRLFAVVVEGENVMQALNVVGETFKADVIDRIKAGIDPPNTEATLAKKRGETTPLIDQGNMIGALTVKVSKRSAGSEGGPSNG